MMNSMYSTQFSGRDLSKPLKPPSAGSAGSAGLVPAESTILAQQLVPGRWWLLSSVQAAEGEEALPRLLPTVPVYLGRLYAFLDTQVPAVNRCRA